MLERISSVLNAHYLFDTMFDGVNLSGIHYCASFIGAIMALYVMQLWTVGALAISNDCWFAKHARRLALLLVALAMLWSLEYSDSKGWTPWPSDVATILAVDLFLFSSIVVAFRKRRVFG
jgi:hypothetical protein